MRRVYIAESLAEGQLVLGLLTGEGILAELFHQNIQGGLGELAVTWPEIWIRHDTDYAGARKLIDSHGRQGQSSGQSNCRTCGESNPDNFEICWQCRTNLP